LENLLFRKREIDKMIEKVKKRLGQWVD
jgi:hypothetical protein